MAQVLTQHAGMDEAELDKYRLSRLVPLMPDFYVGDPGALETYIDGARKMQARAGSSPVPRSVMTASTPKPGHRTACISSFTPAVVRDAVWQGIVGAVTSTFGGKKKK